jgi:hypothetical protein
VAFARHPAVIARSLVPLRFHRTPAFSHAQRRFRLHTGVGGCGVRRSVSTGGFRHPVLRFRVHVRTAARGFSVFVSMVVLQVIRQSGTASIRFTERRRSAFVSGTQRHHGPFRSRTYARPTNWVATTFRFGHRLQLAGRCLSELRVTPPIHVGTSKSARRTASHRDSSSSSMRHAFQMRLTAR